MATPPPYPLRYRRGPTAKPQASAIGGGASPYQLGRRFERATRGRLERRGYFVMRAHGSKGKIDLLAVRMLATMSFDPEAKALVYPIRHLVLGVQCKRRGDIGSAEWNELIDLCEPFGILPVVATKSGERTTSFYRLDERRERGRQGRPWTLIDPATGEPLPVQMALA